MPKALDDDVEYASGDVLAGKYRVDRCLGRGAMGTVYEATQLGLEKKCAVKVMKRPLARRADLVARFRAEARTQSLLEGNAHICAVFDYDVLDEGAPFYAMTLFHGRPLSEWIHDHYVTRQKPFSLQAALAIAQQMCEALAFAHEKGIVHRDIQPENLIVRATGPAWWLVVVDFGVAERKVASEHAGDGFIGTPPYAPREQVLGRPPSPKMDVYAAGVVLFKLLTGRSPLANLGDKGMAALLSAAPPMAALLGDFGDFPRELVSLVARCLSHNPAERPDARYLAMRFRALAQESWKASPAALLNATYEDEIHAYSRSNQREPWGRAGASRPERAAPSSKHDAPHDGEPAATPGGTVVTVTPPETPVAIDRWRQDQERWNRSMAMARRRALLRRLAVRGAIALGIGLGIVGLWTLVRGTRADSPLKAASTSVPSAAAPRPRKP